VRLIRNCFGDVACDKFEQCPLFRAPEALIRPATRSSRPLYVKRGRFIDLAGLFRRPEFCNSKVERHFPPSCSYLAGGLKNIGKESQKCCKTSKIMMQSMHSMPSTSYSSRPSLGALHLNRNSEKRNVAVHASTPLPSKVIRSREQVYSLQSAPISASLQPCSFVTQSTGASSFQIVL